MNLALNAMEAMRNRSGGLRRILIRSRRGDGRYAEASVVDSGPGIPAALLPLMAKNISLPQMMRESSSRKAAMGSGKFIRVLFLAFSVS